MEDWQIGPSVLLSKEHRRQHYYFGGFCDGFYLSFQGSWIRVWGWEKPTQFEVEEYIRIDQEERREDEMARCNSCNKFASYGDPEIEIDSTEIDGTTVTVSATVNLTCAECGDTLKSANIEAQADFTHECEPDGKPDEGWDDTQEQYEAEDPDGEGTDRRETHDRHGKPIKNPRYQRQYYGFTAEVEIHCCKCGGNISVSVEGEEQVSGFEDAC